MIFKTINAKHEKNNYSIIINNIDASSNHWGSEKDIVEYLTMIENSLYEKDKFTDSILDHALTLARFNPRVKNLSFYRVAGENKIIILAKTDVYKFKEPEILSREMTISFKKDNFSLSVIELLETEEKIMKETGKTLPENWQFDDILNNKYKILSTFI